MYSAVPYVLAQTVVQMPFMFALGACALLPSYGIGNFPWVSFGLMLPIYACNAWCFECIAQLFSLSPNPIMGMLSYVNVWSCSMVFTGLVFRGQDVIWPFRVLYYVLPLKWFFNALGYTIFEPSVYGGTTRIPCPSPSNMSLGMSPGAASGVEVLGGEDLAMSPCFFCNGTNSLGCFGESGEEILTSLNLNFETMSANDERGLDVGILLAFAVVAKLLYVVGFIKSCSMVTPPKPSQAS